MPKGAWAPGKSLPTPVCTTVLTSEAGSGTRVPAEFWAARAFWLGAPATRRAVADSATSARRTDGLITARRRTHLRPHVTGVSNRVVCGPGGPPSSGLVRCDTRLV